MSEQMNRANGDQATRPGDVVEIDLKRLLRAVLDKIWVIGISAVLCAALAFGYTHYFITPQYQSSAMFYVNNNSLSVGSASLSLTASDLSVAKNLVDSYIVILKSRTSLNDVIDYTGIDRTYGELRGMISAADVNSTEIFEVVVTSSDPNEAEQIANAIAYILPKRISSIIEGSSAKVVDYAIVPSSPSSPSYPKNTVMGLFLGLVLSAAVIVLREIFDVTIRAEEDIEQCCHHPILAAVPDMTDHSKGGYYGTSNKKKRSKKKSASSDKEVILSGDGISFAAAEAYKLLRTKLQFSFTDESNCRVIGVSSAMVGEGKSLTSVNLAYSLAQLDKRILLIDCDMRRPSVASKLPIQKFPGLSNCLAGHTRLDEVIQSSGTEI
ncbi:MAG: AAA family ATPase, partial [Clostridia bacterium]|nr:AAA family ATPase [Clostridia bacterium]